MTKFDNENTDNIVAIPEPVDLDMPDFFLGMVTAYEDAAQFILHLRDNLPPELAPMKEGFTTLAQGFRTKIVNIELHLSQEGGMQ